jgi:hypothetical protein
MEAIRPPIDHFPLAIRGLPVRRMMLAAGRLFVSAEREAKEIPPKHLQDGRNLSRFFLRPWSDRIRLDAAISNAEGYRPDVSAEARYPGIDVSIGEPP